MATKHRIEEREIPAPRLPAEAKSGNAPRWTPDGNLEIRERVIGPAPCLLCQTSSGGIMFIIGCGEYDDAQNLAVYTGNEDDLRSFIDTVNLGVPEHKSEFWYQELPKAMNIGELQDMLRRGR